MNRIQSGLKLRTRWRVGQGGTLPYASAQDFANDFWMTYGYGQDGSYAQLNGLYFNCWDACYDAADVDACREEICEAGYDLVAAQL